MTPERGVAFRSERLSEDAPVQPFAVSLARWLPVFMSDHCSDGGGGKANNFFVAFFFASSLFSFQCSHCRFTLEWCLTNVSSSEGGKKRGNCRSEQHGGLSGIATTLRIRWNSSAFSCRNELWETAERARHDSQPARSIISQRPRH